MSRCRVANAKGSRHSRNCQAAATAVHHVSITSPALDDLNDPAFVHLVDLDLLETVSTTPVSARPPVAVGHGLATKVGRKTIFIARRSPLPPTEKKVRLLRIRRGPPPPPTEKKVIFMARRSPPPPTEKKVRLCGSDAAHRRRRPGPRLF